MQYLLSICIPTYNRADLLIENIEELIFQITEHKLENKVEICVSDNCSTDNTITFVEELKKKHEAVAISISVNESNLGADRNYLAAMHMGESKFCWLLGSDDKLEKGALNKIVSFLSENQETAIYLFNRLDCDFDFQEKKKRYWLNKNVEFEEFNFSNKSEVSRYFALSNDTGAVFSYISCFIFSREVLNIDWYDDSYIGTAYSFLFYIFSFLKKGNTVTYAADHYVLCRLGNSAFSTNIPARILLDIDGYEKIRNDFFSDDPVNGDLLLGIVKKTYHFHRIIQSYIYLSGKNWRESFCGKLKVCGWSEKELSMSKHFSNPIILIMLWVKLKLSKLINA